MFFPTWQQRNFHAAFIDLQDLSNVHPVLLGVSVDSYLNSAFFTIASQPRAQNEEVRAF